MSKYASFFVIAISTSGFAAVWLCADPSENSIALGKVLANEQIVQDKLTTYRCFKATLESTVEALRKGEMTLREAHKSVHDSASRFNANFLERLSLAETGKSVAARLAQNLVGHVRSIETTCLSVPSPLPKLESELQEMLAEMGE